MITNRGRAIGSKAKFGVIAIVVMPTITSKKPLRGCLSLLIGTLEAYLIKGPLLVLTHVIKGRSPDPLSRVPGFGSRSLSDQRRQIMPLPSSGS